MPRGRKPLNKKEETKTENVKAVKEQSVNNDEMKKLEQENAQLKSSFEDLQKQVEMLTSAITASQAKDNESNVSKNAQQSEVLDIPLNKVVKIMSLYTGGLNLKTAENGKVFRFNNFGDVQPIIYNDLIQIMSHQHRFCNEGYFMILDKDVVKAHALDGLYSKLIDAKQVNNILEYEDEKIAEIINGATKNLKESILDIVVKKINGKDNVDKNKIHVLSELYGMDIFAYARGDVELLINAKNR